MSVACSMHGDDKLIQNFGEKT